MTDRDLDCGSGFKAHRTALPLVLATAAAAASGATVAIASARILGPTGRGVLALQLQVGYLLAPALVAGSDRAILSFASQHGELAARTLANQLALKVSLGAAALGAGTSVVVAFIDPPTAIAIVLTVSFGISQSMTIYAQSVSVVRQRTVHLAIKQSATSLAVVFAAGALYVGEVSQVEWWLLCITAPYLIYGTIQIAGESRSLRRQPVEVISFRSTYRSESLRLLRGNTALTIMLRADRIIVGLIAGTTALGYYATAATFAELASIPGKVGAQAITPHLSKVRGPLVRDFQVRTVVAAGVLGGLVLATVGPPVLVALLGDQFSPAADLLPILGISVMVLVGRHLAGAVMLARARAPELVRLETQAAIASLALYAVLTQSYGMQGAAIASGLAYFFVPARLLLNEVRR